MPAFVTVAMLINWQHVCSSVNYCTFYYHHLNVAQSAVLMWQVNERTLLT